MAAFEDLCRELFGAADERFLILDEELAVSAFSLDRHYVLTCTLADEREGPWEGTVEVSVASDAANGAASLFEDVYDEGGKPMEAAWEVSVRWHGPAVADAGVAEDAVGEMARAAGIDPGDLVARATSELSEGSWVHHPTFEYFLWLADDDDPEEDAARLLAIAEDGLVRLQDLARSWPLAELPDEEEEEGEVLEVEGAEEAELAAMDED
ncbi:MAG: hypothetical protein HY658_00980 [Actinobacteria bacterium]|nr:hypothetical protein [Actinomycetota bacterium]